MFQRGDQILSNARNDFSGRQIAKEEYNIIHFLDNNKSVSQKNELYILENDLSIIGNDNLLCNYYHLQSCIGINAN